MTAGESTFTLPAFIPASMMAATMALSTAQTDPEGATTAIHDIYGMLFGDEHADAAMAAIGLDEMQIILQEVYSVTTGELPASAAP